MLHTQTTIFTTIIKLYIWVSSVARSCHGNVSTTIRLIAMTFTTILMGAQGMKLFLGDHQTSHPAENSYNNSREQPTDREYEDGCSPKVRTKHLNLPPHGCSAGPGSRPSQRWFLSSSFFLISLVTSSCLLRHHCIAALLDDNDCSS